jgi:hypothetical protein
MLVGMEDHRPNIPDAVPKASSEPLPEISSFLEPFAPLFRRSQSRHSLERYVSGLLTDLDRKNCDTIAAAVAGTSTERLQHLLTDADWDPRELDAARVRSLSARSPKGEAPKVASWCSMTRACPNKARPPWELPASTAERWASGPTVRWCSKRPVCGRRTRELTPFALACECSAVPARGVGERSAA